MYTQLGALLIEVIYFGDILAARPAPYLREKLIIYDNLYSVLGMILTEILSIGDQFVKMPRKVFLEVLLAEQGLSTTVLYNIEEVIKLAQSFIKRPTKPMTLETINISDTRTSSVISSMVDEVFALGESFRKEATSIKIEVVKLYYTRNTLAMTYRREAINFTNILSKRFSTILTEEIDLGEFLQRLPTIVKLESIILYPIRRTVISFTKSERLGISGTLIKAPRLIFNEVLELPQTFNITLSTIKLELIKLRQTTIKRPMKYQTPESITVSDVRSTSVLSAMISEVLTVNDTIRRSISVPLIEKVKLTDVKCAKIVSFVTHETLAFTDSKYATLDRTLSEIILLPDSRYMSVLVERLEALLVATKIARVVRYSAFIESISITQSIIPRVSKSLSESISLGTSLTKSVSQVKLELITLGQRFNKKIHAHVLDLETISLSDTRDWYNNLVHRAETVIRQFTKTRTSERTDKEKTIKKITKDSKRE
jgi:hypothetical protein